MCYSVSTNTIYLFTKILVFAFNLYVHTCTFTDITLQALFGANILTYFILFIILFIRENKQ